MQERGELRALKREEKMSREGKIKRKVCVWKRKNEKGVELQCSLGSIRYAVSIIGRVTNTSV
jgi:hypothetical protein